MAHISLASDLHGSAHEVQGQLLCPEHGERNQYDQKNKNKRSYYEEKRLKGEYYRVDGVDESDHTRISHRI